MKGVPSRLLLLLLLLLLLQLLPLLLILLEAFSRNLNSYHLRRKEFDELASTHVHALLNRIECEKIFKNIKIIIIHLRRSINPLIMFILSEFLQSHHMRRYWFYVKNHFWNFHQIFMF